MSIRPQISIVMPSFQQADYVAEAVCSVLEQDDAAAELLVMDPGSSDGSRQILQDLHERFGERLVLCFEPDDGQSDAVNRGMARARAPLLGWLNSDDRLQPGALAAVVEALGGRAGPAWLYGRAGMIDSDGDPITSWIVHYKNWRGRRFSRWRLLTENFIPQMAVFWNRAIWDEAGGLDCNRDLDMDYDLWFRFARSSDPLVLRRELAAFRVHHAAKGSQRTNEQLAAAQRTARKHSADVGWSAGLALGLHRVYCLRTRLAYRWLKP